MPSNNLISADKSLIDIAELLMDILNHRYWNNEGTIDLKLFKVSIAPDGIKIMRDILSGKMDAQKNRAFKSEGSIYQRQELTEEEKISLRFSMIYKELFNRMKKNDVEFFLASLEDYGYKENISEGRSSKVQDLYTVLGAALGLIYVHSNSLKKQERGSASPETVNVLNKVYRILKKLIEEYDHMQIISRSYDAQSILSSVTDFLKKETVSLHINGAEDFNKIRNQDVIDALHAEFAQARNKGKEKLAVKIDEKIYLYSTAEPYDREESKEDDRNELGEIIDTENLIFTTDSQSSEQKSQEGVLPLFLIAINYEKLAEDLQSSNSEMLSAKQ